VVGGVGGASSNVDESLDGNLPSTRLLVLFYQREHLLAYSLPWIARSGDSRPLADVAMLFPGGLVDLTRSSGLRLLIIVRALLTRSFKTTTRTSC
jgi:hypothetical protein